MSDYLFQGLHETRSYSLKEHEAAFLTRQNLIFSIEVGSIAFNFFFYQGFLHRHWQFSGQQGNGGDHLLFHSAISTHSRTLRYLFATLHVRWLSRIFNRNACVYQTATRWDLPPYRITIWVIDWRCNVCLFTKWIDTRFLLQRFDIGNRWFELASTITLVSQANRLTKYASHPKPTNQVCQSPHLF